MTAAAGQLTDRPELAATIVIGTEEAAWARRLLASMPFGAMAHFRSIHKPDALTVRDILDDVDRLREVLVELAASREDVDAELSQLRADVAAVRRIFGSPAVMHGYDGDGRAITVKAAAR